MAVHAHFLGVHDDDGARAFRAELRQARARDLDSLYPLRSLHGLLRISPLRHQGERDLRGYDGWFPGKNDRRPLVVSHFLSHQVLGQEAPSAARRMAGLVSRFPILVVSIVGRRDVTICNPRASSTNAIGILGHPKTLRARANFVRCNVALESRWCTGWS